MRTIREQLKDLDVTIYPTGVKRYAYHDEEHDKVLEFFQKENENTLEVTIHSDNFFTTKTVVDLDDEINLNDIVNKSNIY